MQLLPKEHGAYGQMAMPLLAALCVAGPSLPAVLLALAVIAGFLAHEPLVVRLGLRGERARRELGHAAVAVLAVEGAVALSAAVAGLWLAPPAARWACLLPLAAAGVLSAAVARRRPKSLTAELSAALAFSLAAVPVCLAAGSRGVTAAAVALPFALVFMAATCAVRAVTHAGRGGGQPQTVAAMRLATMSIVAVGVLGLALAASRGLLPWPALAAALPGAVLAAALAIAPPAPQRLRAVGWALLAVSVAAVVVLVAA